MDFFCFFGRRRGCCEGDFHWSDYHDRICGLEGSGCSFKSVATFRGMESQSLLNLLSLSWGADLSQCCDRLLESSLLR